MSQTATAKPITPPADRIAWTMDELSTVIDNLGLIRSVLASSNDPKALRSAIAMQKIEGDLLGIVDVLENGW